GRVRLRPPPPRRPARHRQGPHEAPPEQRSLLVRALRADATTGRQRVPGAREPDALGALSLERDRAHLRAMVRALRGSAAAREGALPPAQLARVSSEDRASRGW